MKITKQDFNETTKLAALLSKIDNIDAGYVNEISEEIVKHQPFFMTVLLGYRFDTSPEELEEIMKIYFLIWEFFREKNGVRSKGVTGAYFERVQNGNIRKLEYAQGLPQQKDRLEIYSADIQSLKSKTLWTAVLFRFKNKPVLSKMGEENRGIILIGMRSFIECFETV